MFYLLPTTRNNGQSQKQRQKASATAFATAGCILLCYALYNLYQVVLVLSSSVAATC